MALVGVEDLGLRMAGQRAERPHRPHSADAEQQLLPEPVLAAAAVEPVGDLAQRRVVLLDVESSSSSGTRPTWATPDLRGQHPAPGQGNGDRGPAARRRSASSVSGSPFGSVPG